VAGRLPRKAKAALTIMLVAILVGAPAGVGYAAYQHDASMRGLLPAGSEIGGIDVSKLDRAAAVHRVKTAVERDWDRPATVTVGGHAYSTTLRELGVTHDVEAAVARAFEAAENGNWLTRAWHRLVDGSSAPREDVEISAYDPARLAAIADQAAAEQNVPARNAGVTEKGGWLRFSAGRTGWAVDTKAVAGALAAALEDGTPRSVDLVPVKPGGQQVEKAILVRTGENKLYLYERGTIIRTYGVATGSPRYPTPTGRFEVVLKRYRPTWYNPWSPWSMHEPAIIGPGPSNPLGTRAMNLSAPGIRIHGTPAWRSIGYSVSHGCIRMRMPDVEALYPLVDVHTPVFIVRAAPARLPGTPVPVTDPANAADGG
jgi:lipoprotein-anchoring transpeptidase ErfK/SrfK